MLKGDLIEHLHIDLSSEISLTTWVKHNGMGYEYHTGLVFNTSFILFF